MHLKGILKGNLKGICNLCFVLNHAMDVYSNGYYFSNENYLKKYLKF